VTLPQKCLIDTNVAVNANLATRPKSKKAGVPGRCIKTCIQYIENITKYHAVLVLDRNGEIFNEYRHNLSLKGQPGVGDVFIKWVNDNQWNPQKIERIAITRNGDSYDEFPSHEHLKNFDPSDRKFVAVANAHPARPPILQATDSKWWGWKAALEEAGITVQFLCPKYARKKYKEKIGS
jgi:hypothetical protein